MSRSRYTGIVALVVAACTGGAGKDAGTTDAGASGQPGSATTAGRELASGTRVNVTLQQGVSSRTNAAGDTVPAIVSLNITDAKGRVVIPAGSNVTLRIAQLEPGSDQVRPEGRLSLAVSTVTINNDTYPLDAILEPVPHHFEERGITRDAAARTASRDVVVSAGTPIVFTLTQSFNIAAR